MKQIIKRRKKTRQRGGDVLSPFAGGDIFQASSTYLMIVELRTHRAFVCYNLLFPPLQPRLQDFECSNFI